MAQQGKASFCYAMVGGSYSGSYGYIPVAKREKAWQHSAASNEFQPASQDPGGEHTQGVLPVFES